MAEFGDRLWTPSQDVSSSANISRYIETLNAKKNLAIEDYQSLWRWSIENIEAFWASIAEYFEVEFYDPPNSILKSRNMPGAEWFPGASLNFAAQALRPSRGTESALMNFSEDGEVCVTSWDDLASEVRRLATSLRELGVRPGDRIACLMPNVKEATVALFASAAIGAIFSACSPEYGVTSILDRFKQIEPKVLFVADCYTYGGKRYDCKVAISKLVENLKSLEAIVWRKEPTADEISLQLGGIDYDEFVARVDIEEKFQFEHVDFSHPLWILYTSGTTGPPKPIVQGHGGIVLELLKFHSFHMNLGPGDRNFFYTTTGWVMFGVTAASLMVGATAVTYDGDPTHSDFRALWQVAHRAEVAAFGASPGFVQLMINNSICPTDEFEFRKLKTVMLGGSPATPETMNWFYESVKKDLYLTSQSGGTDVSTAFVGGAPILPLNAGRIQAPMLGVDVVAYNDAGAPVVDEVGELVVRQPMPSMPISFWGDKDMELYRAAYFEHFPGVWRHGDFIEFNASGESIVFGRSDATLNRQGVRIGTSEIYRIVEQHPLVDDSLVVVIELDAGDHLMLLFVKPVAGVVLAPEQFLEIENLLRTHGSPRHVPDFAFETPSVPYTLTGKKQEVPVKNILMGKQAEESINRGAMRDPDALEYYVVFANSQVFRSNVLREVSNE